jgi:hypothetical protein
VGVFCLSVCLQRTVTNCHIVCSHSHLSGRSLQIALLKRIGVWVYSLHLLFVTKLSSRMACKIVGGWAEPDVAECVLNVLFTFDKII